MARDNYAIAGHGIRRSGSDLWIVPIGIKIHFLSYDDRSVSFGTLGDTVREIVTHPEKTPYQVVKTITGNGTVLSTVSKILCKQNFSGFNFL